MSMNSYKARLSLNILEEHFGGITKDVASVIITTENATLLQIAKKCAEMSSSRRITLQQVRESLLVLQQHNCLIIELPPEVDVEGDALAVAADRLKQSGLVYSLNMDMIVNRLRFPKVISIAKKLFGDVGVVVMEEIALHGRLKVAQICADAASRLIQAAIAQPSSETTSSSTETAGSGDGAAEQQQQHQLLVVEPEVTEEKKKLIEAEVLHIFEQLVQRRLIVPVPPLDIRKKLVERAAKNAETLQRLGRSSGAAGPGSARDVVKHELMGVGGGGGASTTATTKGKRKRKDAAAEEVSEDLPVELRMMLAAAQQPGDDDEIIAIAGGIGAGAGAGIEEVVQPRKISRVERAADVTSAPAPAAGGRAGVGRGRGRGGRGGRGGGAAAVKAEKGGGAAMPPSLEEWTATATAVQSPGGRGYGPGSGLGLSAAAGSGGNGNGSREEFGPREDVLWTIGWEQYIREERHKLSVTMVRDRMEKVAGVIVRIMLEFSMPTEAGPTQKLSSPISTMDIFEKLRSGGGVSSSHLHAAAAADLRQGAVSGAAGRHKAVVHIKPEPTGTIANQSSTTSAAAAAAQDGEALASKIDLSTLRKLMDLLRLDAVGIVTKVPGSEKEEGGPYYMVNMESVVSAIRRKTIHSIALERYGPISARIVEMLQRRKYLEQQQIADLAIVPARDARERLYRLFRDRWVNYLELSKRADFNPSSTSFFWFLDVVKLDPLLLEHLYKSIMNIRIRRFQEFQQGRALLEANITDAVEAAQFDKLASSLARLDRAVLRLDDTLLLLDKF